MDAQHSTVTMPCQLDYYLQRRVDGYRITVASLVALSH